MAGEILNNPGPWELRGLGNLAFINRAVRLVNPTMTQGGGIIQLGIRFAIGGVVEMEATLSPARSVLEKLL